MAHDWETVEIANALLMIDRDVGKRYNNKPNQNISNRNFNLKSLHQTK